jgi:hypothetical protein
MPDPPVTRADLRRALVLNALVHPVNVLVPAGVLVAAALFGAAWLAVVAVVCWLVLAGMTFFDEREAARVGKRLRAAHRNAAPAAARADPGVLAPAIRARVRAAVVACAAIRDAIAASPAALDDVGEELDALLAAIYADAERAQRIHAFLAEEPPGELEERIAQEPRAVVREALQGKLAALSRVRERLDGLLAEMDHVVATLQTLQAEILSADGAELALEERALASQVSELRAKVRIISTGLEESFAETRVRGAP